MNSNLLVAVPMKHQVLRKLGDLYQLSASTNVEIQFRWIVLSLKSKDASIIPVAADFLSKHGRGLYVLPMYRALNDLDHARAVQIYHANRSFYHNILTTRLDVSLAK
jgi:leukotriene-A4 hydrolase